ncbi:MAG: corrinoid protein [Thermoanaerobacterales bacterium]|nr:corrinoid protein [Thermoanaerobacterales bacterium]
MATFEDLAQSVIEGNVDKVKSLAQSLLDAGSNPLEIINKGLIAGMNVVGARFKAMEMFVPEVLMCAKAMSAGMEVVKPHIAEQEVQTSGKIIIGTVKNDLHDIGKNLVAMMLESSGFEVINLGIDLSPSQFVEAIKEHKPDIVGLSALLTNTLPFMKDTIDAIEEAGLRDQVKVIIGGAPVTQEYADKIGADGYAPEAASAAELCKKLVANS